MERGGQSYGIKLSKEKIEQQLIRSLFYICEISFIFILLLSSAFSLSLVLHKYSR